MVKAADSEEVAIRNGALNAKNQSAMDRYVSHYIISEPSLPPYRNIIVEYW